MLLDTAVSFFKDKSPVAAVRSRLETEHGFERSTWDEIVALGWSSLAIPTEYGGSGLSLAEAATIAEPMGRHLFAAPLTSTHLFVQGVLAAGSSAQKNAHLARVCDGAVATVALFETEGSWEISRPTCTATSVGGSLRLSGTKILVTDAAAADLLLVSARHGNATVLIVLTASDIPASARRRETVIDETRRSYRLQLDGITVPSNRMLASGAGGIEAIRNAALLLVSAEAAGGIAGVLDITVDYLNTRTAFGRKIGSFQALKHTCADILIGLERSRSHVYHAATVLAAGEAGEAALRMAKVEACDSFAFAGDRAIQFHGGFGFTYECDAQLYLRRALWLQYWFGDGPHHRKRLAELLLPAP